MSKICLRGCEKDDDDSSSGFCRKCRGTLVADCIEISSRIFALWLDDNSRHKASLQRNRQRLSLSVLAIEYLWEYWNDLYRLLIILSRSPHTQLYRESLLLPAGDIQELNLDLMESTVWKERDKRCVPVSDMLPAWETKTMVDTAEHRIIKAYLNDMAKELNKAIPRLEEDLNKKKEFKKKESSESDNEVNEKRKELFNKIHQVRQKIARVLRFDFMQETTLLPFLPILEPTLVFRHNPLYRRIYAILQKYKNLLLQPKEGFGVILDNELYERWCFWRLIEFFEKEYRLHPNLNDVFKWADKGYIELKSQPGIRGADEKVPVKFFNDKEKEIIYQKHFKEGPIVGFRPDFTCYLGDGRVIILDAKCRDLKNEVDKEKRREQSDDAPTQSAHAAIHQLHAYKDGLMEEGKKVSPEYVIALVPVKNSEKVKEGIGYISFWPGETEKLKNYL